MRHNELIRVRWPAGLKAELVALAERELTTVSELTRQAVIDQYGLFTGEDKEVDH